MAKGRYLKAAERACSVKTRFETAAEAERTAEYRFRAYRCPVCHRYHLTSGAGSASPAPEPKPKPVPPVPGPKLADLDWSAALDPKPKAPRAEREKLVAPRTESLEASTCLLARCTGPAGKDHRVHLVLDGRLVKSAAIKDASLREQLATDVWVVVAPNIHPIVLRVQRPEYQS